ncbi:MAG: hypothetical protein ABEJ30_07040 [Halorientalis sp.]
MAVDAGGEPQSYDYVSFAEYARTKCGELACDKLAALMVARFNTTDQDFKYSISHSPPGIITYYPDSPSNASALRAKLPAGM